MKPLFTILKSIGVIFLGFIVIFIVNAPHDYVINAITKGTARNQIPIGAQAEIISCCFVFLAGFLASIMVYLLGGRQRSLLLVILVVLFLLVDLAAAFSKALYITSFYYRVGIVALVPLEVWTGYLAGKWLRTVNK